MDEYMGIIKLFAGTFAPRGFMLCQGQLLSISQWSALYSILGTQYGGDGQQTFALPNLSGRVGIGTGLSPQSATNYKEGDFGGSENNTLSVANIPAHQHNSRLQASSTNATYSTPTTKSFLAAPGETVGRDFKGISGYTDQDPDLQISPTAISEEVVGSGASFKNMQPYLAMNYIICVEGVYPSRP